MQNVATESLKKLPLVSIIIPVYNGSNFLGRAVDSALSQTYANVEIIVVNDGSQDDGKTKDIALSYGDKIRYIEKENGGVSSALNLGIENMRGEYFSWLSHDDEYEPEKIEKEVAEIIKYDGKVIVFCSDYHIDEDSLPISPSADFGLKNGQLIKPDEMVIKLLKKNPVDGCTVLAPKSAFIDCGGFNEKHRYIQDIEEWINFSLSGYSWKFSDYAGVRSRIHGKQLTLTGREVFFTDCAEWSEFIAEEMAKREENARPLCFNLAAYFARYGAKVAKKNTVKTGKKYGVLTIGDRIKLTFVGLYGSIRPTIRKLYYKFTLKNRKK